MVECKGLKRWMIKNGGECEGLEGMRRKSSRVAKFNFELIDLPTVEN